MVVPTPKALSEAASISSSYASMILNTSDDPAKSRTPPRPLAIHIFRTLGWKHPTIADLSDEQINFLEQIEPYRAKPAPTEQQAAA